MDNESLALMIPIVAIGCTFLMLIIGIISTSVRKSVETRAREESRREIAAYVAEGSISPDDAAKLLEAGKKKNDWGCGPKA